MARWSRRPPPRARRAPAFSQVPWVRLAFQGRSHGSCRQEEQGSRRPDAEHSRGGRHDAVGGISGAARSN
eukprot:3616563-Lingulodinium_polyedra.AAC.1